VLRPIHLHRQQLALVACDDVNAAAAIVLVQLLYAHQLYTLHP
jgi:hypothetical protein